MQETDRKHDVESPVGNTGGAKKRRKTEAKLMKHIGNSWGGSTG